MRTALGIVLVSTFVASAAAAQTTYRIGEGEPDGRELADLPALGPGDTVEVVGGQEYQPFIFDFEWDGSEAAPIRIVGIPVAGARPIFTGGVNTLEFQGDHYEVEQIEVTGGSFRCIFHHAHDITITDSLVHDCPAHGILGADTDSGSLTLVRVEVHHAGGGDRDHQIYMATDETAHPGSVFRMENCWVHDGNGGNNVKSRAERNEIYSNWIEGAYYHELELIGPDGQDETLAREDSDVVGNVLVKRGSNEGFAVVRFGGDGTGQTDGRYRFVNNTVVLAPGDTSAIFRLFEGLESVEMHNNVFVRRGGGGVNVIREVEAVWATGSRLIAGSHNWVPTGSENVPPEWTDTIMGSDPGLVDVDAFDLAIALESAPIVDQGAIPTPNFDAAPFPSPLERPLSSPAHGALGVARPVVGAIDLGAYEYGTAPPEIDAGTSSRDGGAGMEMDGGCGCRAGARGDAAPSALFALSILALLLRRR
jgi:MYXO-CTERM domain-containing protein